MTIIQVVVKPAEKKWLELKAKEDSMTLSAWCRKALLFDWWFFTDEEKDMRKKVEKR